MQCKSNVGGKGEAMENVGHGSTIRQSQHEVLQSSDS